MGDMGEEKKGGGIMRVLKGVWGFFGGGGEGVRG